MADPQNDPQIDAQADSPSTFSYTSKTDVELRQLALDYVDGKMFTDKQIPEYDQHLIFSIFMPLTFIKDDQWKEFVKDLGMVYEYFDQAGMRSINGYPMFMSLRYLNREDTEKLRGYVDKLIDQRQAFLADSK